MAKLWAVGDSWSYGYTPYPSGHPLDDNRYPHAMVEELAHWLELTPINLSRAGSGIGCITEDFFVDVKPNLEPGDVVFVCAPPDIRWHTVNNSDPDDLRMMPLCLPPYEWSPDNGLIDILKMNDFSLYYFTFHYNVFIQSIAATCKSMGVECYVQHNYGDSPVHDWADAGYYLDPDNSMWNWMGLPDISSMRMDYDGPYIDPNSAEYKQLAGKLIYIEEENHYDLHPNEEWQIKIGQMLYQKIQDKRDEL